MKHRYQKLYILYIKAPVKEISKRNGLGRLVPVYIDNEVLFYATYSVD